MAPPGHSYSTPALPRRFGDNPAMTSRRGLALFAALMALTHPVPAAAARYEVDSLAALQAKIAGAAPGDVITVKDGVYTTTAPIAIMARGTGKRPVRIVARTPGGVTIEGTDGFDVAATAAYV